MSVEVNPNYPSDLDSSIPTNSDFKAEGDDHIRNTKRVLKATFPNVTGAITATHTQINSLAASGGLYSVGTSTTSLTIGAGTQSFTTQASLGFAVGQSIKITSNADVTNYMLGTCAAYNSTTGAMSVSVSSVGGAGTAASWSITVSVAPQGVASATVDLLTGTAIASAATINLDTATGNRVHITGTTTITAVTLTRGPRTVIFDGVLTLTHNATTNNLPGAANITTAAGDRAVYAGDGTTVYCVSYTKADGTAVALSNPAFGAAGTAVVTESSTSAKGLAICALSSTRFMGIYAPASGQPKAVLMDQTGTVINATVIEAVTMLTGTVHIVRLTSTTALALYPVATVSGGVRAVVLTDSGATITVGTIVSAEAIDSGSVCLVPLSATKAIAAYQSLGGGTTRMVCLTIATATITVATPVNLAAVEATKFVRGAAISSTQAVFLYGQTTTATAVTVVVTEAATVLTPASSVSLNTNITNTNDAEVCPISSTRVGFFYGSNGVTGGVGVMDVSGTGASAKVQLGPVTPVASCGSSQHPRMTQLSANTLLLQTTGAGNAGTTVRPLSVRGDNLIPGDGRSLAISSGAHDLCLIGTTSLMSFYVDSNNSSFPTARPTPLGTVV